MQRRLLLALGLLLAFVSQALALAGQQRTVMMQPPGWVQASTPGAAVVEDFAHGRFWTTMGYTGPLVLNSITRAGPKTVTTLGGLVQTITNSNQLAYSDQGESIEEARTNLTLQSQNIGVTWSTTNGATVNSTATTAPDGTNQGGKVIRAVTATNYRISQTISISAASVYTYSVYAKAAELNWLFLNEVNTSNATAFFNLSTGTVGTVGVGATASISSLGNSWYRCTIKFTAGSASANIWLAIAPADNTQNFTSGNATDGLYVYGAQLELGSFATSYIPTTTVAVFRANDVVTAIGPLLSAIQSPAVTLQLKTAPISGIAVGNPRIFGYQGGITPAAVQSNTQTTIYNGVTAPIASLGSGAFLTTNVTTVASHDSSGMSIVSNGGTETTNAAVMPAITNGYAGSQSGTSTFLNGPLRSIGAWASRLPAAVRSQLSQP